MAKKKKPSQVDLSLIDAVDRRDVKTVRKALAEGADPNVSTTVNEPELFYPVLLDAADKGDLAMVKLLLDAGADINLRSNYDFSALTVAVDGGHLPVVKLLLDRGGEATPLFGMDDPRWSFTLLTSALNLADSAPPPSLKLVRVLLEAGVDPNQPDGYGQTPLMLAAHSGKMPLVKVLLDAGADPMRDGGVGLFAVDMSDAQGHAAISKLLRKKGSPTPEVAATARVKALGSIVGGKLQKRVKPRAAAWLKARAAKPDAIDALEKRLAVALPIDLRAWLALYGGGKGEGPLFVGHDGLWLEDIVTHWEGQQPLVEARPIRRPVELKKTQKQVRWTWWSPRWVPFARSLRGDFLVVDLDPGAGGQVGQVLRWSPKTGPSLPVAASFKALLASFAQDLDFDSWRYSGGVLTNTDRG
ncbi:ankyrin repeat domain-containing protein [Myxococcus sp. K15C18031901]|uniref:ankyrin repeat domain-containing protein n=1 Tax=Myxococcus dinghuensis TaxID=2906761 RepID=UPI0020A7C103|nr:ankyrin repeat domain-containing protein [Myxococcus dinghuensis]MCP3100061.1 ankyrin repeat domain-containing protein [Myxococcus dinghuensis]